MKFTYNWLKDFVEIKISPTALADKLTMAGLEVTSLEEKQGDFVFEVEVTSNRPDWLSVIGIAHEVAAITGVSVSRLASEPVNWLTSEPVSRLASLHRQTGTPANRHTGSPANQLTIHIENSKDCPSYTARIIRGVKVGPSPDWLKKRLELIGCRSVNNIVDITNLCMFETGEPLHAFDLDKLVSQLTSEPVSRLGIVVRRALNNEEIITIDGIKRILDENILIIASLNRLTGSPAHRHTTKPIAIAGIMGTKNTEVTEGTKNILLEAAVFNPILVRRAKQKLGLQSESSYRFERGVNFKAVEASSQGAARLINELAGGSTVLTKSSVKLKIKQKAIILNTLDVSRILGVNISASRIKKILTGLGFKISKRSKAKGENKFLVSIPSHRPDINLAEDLIEEISRIFGYETIPATLPKISPKLLLCQERNFVSLSKNILVGLGLNEVITHSLIDKGLLKNFNPYTEAVSILNPLSREQEVLRPIILPGLLTAITYNLNQKQEYVSIFEVARVFLKIENAAPKEELVLGIGLCGIRPVLFEGGLIKDEFSFLHLKGILEVLFERLGIQEYNFSVESALGVSVDVCKERIGRIITLSKEACDEAGIKNKKVWLAQVSLEKVFKYANLVKKFIALPKYPGITRDISFIIKEDIGINEILKVMQQNSPPLLRSIRIVDYYKGRQIPQDCRSLTISCFYCSDERTLTEEEITPLCASLRSILSERFSAKIRGN
ncbi:MAG: phenylalanine--tRNA ligase subunit beta [Candidatus Omnitrophota bacterium]|nr:phenylalanine--tRNA ligase subunit beta [Candidatus Omnitrophota bacterium]